MRLTSALLLICATLGVSCSKSNFQSKEGSGAAPANDSDPKDDNSTEAAAKPGEQATETFSLDNSAGKIDMVWVLDNSPSMDDNLKKVTANTRAFVEQIKKRADIKLMVISSKISKDISDVSQATVNVKVLSHDGPTLAAAASCVADGDAYESDTTCGVKIPDMSGAKKDSYEDVQGKLVDKFRSGAKRVYVFVTDDDAIGGVSTDFIDVISASGGKDAVVFAIAGIRAHTRGCSVDAVGTVYQTLATKTGGQVFDICATDWGTHFDVLAKSVSGIANAVFKLKEANVTKITEVKQGTVVLSPSQYSLQGAELTIDPKALKADGGAITVTYPRATPAQ